MKSVSGLLALAGLVLAACGSSGGGGEASVADTETPVTSAPAPASAAPTTAAPVTVPSSTTDEATSPEPPEAIKVIFDGKGCTASGPTSVTTGEQYFIVDSPKYFGMELYVSMLLDGHGYQDLLDPQTGPGDYYPKPSWVVYATRTPGAPSGRILAEDEQEYRYTLDQPEHLHVIYLGTPGGLWFCSPLEVTDP